MSLEVPDREHVELLRKSMDQVGCLTPIIVNQDNPKDIVSGKHRALAEPNCPQQLKKVESELHRELIIVHGNVQRQVPEDVTKYRLIRVARLLSTTGGMVNGKMVEPVANKQDVCAAMEKIIPFNPSYIRRLLPDDYKHVEKRNKPKSETPILSTGPTQEPEQEGEEEQELTERQEELMAPFQTTPEKTVGQLATEGFQEKTLYPSPDCHCKPVKVICPDCGKEIEVVCPTHDQCYGGG